LVVFVGFAGRARPENPAGAGLKTPVMAAKRTMTCLRLTGRGYSGSQCPVNRVPFGAWQVPIASLSSPARPTFTPCGEVAEWSIAPHSKCGVRASVPGVRIPPSPPVPSRQNFSARLAKLKIPNNRAVRHGGLCTASLGRGSKFPSLFAKFSEALD
jgi:hypothetical protein